MLEFQNEVTKFIFYHYDKKDIDFEDGNQFKYPRKEILVPKRFLDKLTQIKLILLIPD